MLGLGATKLALRISVSGFGWMWADSLGLKSLADGVAGSCPRFSEQARVQLGRLGVFIRSARVGCQKLVTFGTNPCICRLWPSLSNVSQSPGAFIPKIRSLGLKPS